MKASVLILVIVAVLSLLFLGAALSKTKEGKVTTVTVQIGIWKWHLKNPFEGRYIRKEVPVNLRVYRGDDFTIVHFLPSSGNYYQQQELLGRLDPDFGTNIENVENREEFLAAMLSLVPKNQRSISLLYVNVGPPPYRQKVIGLVAR